jgi:hypothetical protein
VPIKGGGPKTDESPYMEPATSHAVTAEECRDAIERICASSGLKRAARLRDFLRYVGELSLQGTSASEYEIGTHVFGRRENFDTTSDNIVRVTASELRKRIHNYYLTEGTGEEIFVDIPRGSYTPQFSLRSSNLTTSAEEPNSATQPESDQTDIASPFPEKNISWLNVRHHGTLFVAILLAIACLSLAYKNNALQTQLHPWKSEQILSSFWSGILESSHNTDIVIGDTSVETVEFILHENITLSDYLNHGYIDGVQASRLSPQMKSDLLNLSARHDGSISDFRVAEKILGLEPNDDKVTLEFAREYRSRNIDGHNIILIGSSVSNPWTSVFESQLTFVIGYDNEKKEMVARDRSPLQSESTVYLPSGDSNKSVDYAIVDYIPNPSLSGDVIIIAGTNSIATEAAGNFLTSEYSLHHFADRLHVRKLPYFELLLKTTRLQGAPITADIVAYRTFPARKPPST